MTVDEVLADDPASLGEQQPAPVAAPVVESRPVPVVASDDDKKKRAAYMRDYRAKKSGKKPDAAEAPAAEEKPSKAELKAIEDALTGTIDAATEAVRLLAAGGDAPAFGRERSESVARLWAPVLAKKLDDPEKLMELLRYGATAGLVLPWAREVAAHRAERKRAKAPSGLRVVAKESPASSAPTAEVAP